ncbi:hypothetical protein C0J52_07709, partial [Blattella germanica]
QTGQNILEALPVLIPVLAIFFIQTLPVIAGFEAVRSSIPILGNIFFQALPVIASFEKGTIQFNSQTGRNIFIQLWRMHYPVGCDMLFIFTRYKSMESGHTE